jgi:hypothetical protein
MQHGKDWSRFHVSGNGPRFVPMDGMALGLDAEAISQAFRRQMDRARPMC